MRAFVTVATVSVEYTEQDVGGTGGEGGVYCIRVLIWFATVCIGFQNECNSIRFIRLVIYLLVQSYLDPNKSNSRSRCASLKLTVGIIPSLAHVGIANADTAKGCFDSLTAFNPLIDFDFGRTDRRTRGQFTLFAWGGGGAAHCDITVFILP